MSVLLPGVLAVPLVPAPAEAAGEFWKTQRVTSPAWFDGVESFGKGNTWFYQTQYSWKQMPVWRWNGKRLVRTTMPVAFKGGIADLDFTSKTNGWAVGVGTDSVENLRKVTVLRWNGKAWRIVKTGKAGRLDVPQIKALPGGGAVVTGLMKGIRGKPLEWRFNGKKWKTVTVKANVHHLSGNHAIGLFKNGDSLTRWNGRAWKRVKIGAMPAKGPGGFVLLKALDAPSAKDIWVLAEVDNDLPRATYVLHGNGKRWKRVRVPLPRYSHVHDIASDGKGGVWITVDPDNTMEGVGTKTLLLHLLPSGRWQKTRTKVLAHAMARVPATTSLWAVGRTLSGTNGFFTRGAR